VAVFAATDLEVTIDDVDFSASLAAVTLDISKEQLETTAFGDAARTYIAGLQDASVTFSFHQDFAVSAVDATLHAALGTEVAIVVKPTSGAVGVGNPSYSFNALVTQIVPFSSNVGDLATQDVSFPISGAITRATS
jgi:NAD(P)H-dependent flavin oxidoreductase YrpB (nitropropane dioxygenase family)